MHSLSLILGIVACRSIPYNNSSLCRLSFPYTWFFIHDIEPSHVHRYVATYRIGPLYVHHVPKGLVLYVCIVTIGLIICTYIMSS